jgi:teichuronic acid biosynthesis glycosyltransferase TuaG
MLHRQDLSPMVTGPFSPLVSVIMPAHNAERFVAQAVTSVLQQSHMNLQLIIVNDGSTDGTRQVLDAVNDPRVQVIHQENEGVSHARNQGLARSAGELICFLDADDRMPPGSLSHRLAVFEHDPGLSFVDGSVVYCDADLSQTDRRYAPNFSGDPFPLLLAFDRRCFFGNTWMIRREALGTSRFQQGLTHAEDLLFYLELASNGRRYGSTQEPVLHYRVTGQSSMVALERLEHGYHVVLRWMRERPHLVSSLQLRVARWKVRRMMCGTYVHAGRPIAALAALFR